ncbi:MAG: hypothetical protein CL675_01835 [Bdellovibrionaceae bacterium]|nr:hypothetical protein [Pseudobdellovibrionaceae bacterium]
MIGFITALITTICLGHQAEAAMNYQGLDRRDQVKVERLIISNQGKITPALVDDIIRTLSKTASYRDIEVFQQNGKDYLIKVSKVKRISEIEFNEFDSSLTELVRQSLTLGQDQVFQQSELEKNRAAIEQTLKDQGYLNPSVEAMYFPVSDTDILIRFKVDPGPPTRIANLEVVSQNPELESKLERHLAKFRKQRIQPELTEEITQAAQEFLRDQNFFSSRVGTVTTKPGPSDQGLDLLIPIQSPFKYQLFLENNQKKSQIEIFSGIKLGTMALGQPEPEAEIANRIRNLYLDSGYADATVTPRIKTFKDSPFLRRAFFKIEEKKRIRLRRYRIEGKFSRPQSFYGNFINEHSSELIDSGYYKKDDIDVGIENLVNSLRNEGYLQAKVNSVRVEFNPARDQATVVISLDEGPLTQVGVIRLSGNSHFPRERIFELLKLAPGDPLRLSELEKSLEDVISFYRSNGFLEARFEGTDQDFIDYNQKAQLANIQLKINEGPRVRVRSIRIEGNTFTKSKVVIRELEIEPGTVLTPELLDRSTRRLNNLGLFRTVNLTTQEQNTNIEQRTLVVKVKERLPGTVRFGPGIISEINSTDKDIALRASGAVSYNNLLGTAPSISLFGVIEQDVQQTANEVTFIDYRISAGYLEPHLFGHRTRLRLVGTRSERKVSESLSSEDDEGALVLKANEINLFLEKQFNDQITFIWQTYGLESVQSLSVGSDDDSERNPVEQIASIGPIVEFDYRDNSFVPKSGTYTRFLFEYANPNFGSSDLIHFYSTEAYFNFYVPIGGVVWANSFRGGLQESLSKKTDGENTSGIPSVRVFSLGGLSTLRGFSGNQRDKQVVPNYELDIATSDAEYLPVKGKSQYGLIKTEFRIPLVSSLQLALFYDGGAVFVEDVDQADPYRDNWGFGFRFETPVGPISADFAFLLDRKRNVGPSNSVTEDPFQFHFSIGSF